MKEQQMFALMMMRPLVSDGRLWQNKRSWLGRGHRPLFLSSPTETKCFCWAGRYETKSNLGLFQNNKNVREMKIRNQHWHDANWPVCMMWIKGRCLDFHFEKATNVKLSNWPQLHGWNIWVRFFILLLFCGMYVVSNQPLVSFFI